MDEEDLQNLKTDVELMKLDTRYIKERIDELRAEVRLLSDSMIAIGDVTRLCREHDERGKEFDTFKTLVTRHETYFVIGGIVLVMVLGFIFEIGMKLW
jgi:hypothetical protein